MRALKWLSTASAEDILKVIPVEYALGDRSTYLAALERSRPGYSKDGLIPSSGAVALYQVLKRFDPAVQEAAGNLDILQAYENRFVEKTAAAQVR